MGVALPGCQKFKKLLGKKEPEKIPYVLLFQTEEFFPDTHVEGASLLLNGEAIGEIRTGVESAYRTIPAIKLEWPSRSTLAGKGEKLTLRFPTPCGHQDVQLDDYRLISRVYENGVKPDDEKLQRKRASAADPFDAEIVIGKGITFPKPAVVWVDDRGTPSAKVTFGARTITQRAPGPTEGRGPNEPGRRQPLWGANCAASHVVTVDGKEVGKADSTDKNGSAFLIATEPGRCYRQIDAAYSSNPMFGSGDRSYYVAGGQVHAIGWTAIDFFLMPPPSSVQGSGQSSRLSLDRVECKPEKPAAKKR